VQLKTHPIELPEPLEDGSVKRFWFSHFLPETEIQLRRRKSGKSISTNWQRQKTEDRTAKPGSRSMVYNIYCGIGRKTVQRSTEPSSVSVPVHFRPLLLFSHLAFRSPASGYSTLHKRRFLNFPGLYMVYSIAVLFCSPRSPQINKYIVR